MSDRTSLYHLRLDAEPDRREALQSRIRSAAAAELVRRQHAIHPGESANPLRADSGPSGHRWRLIFLNLAAALALALLWQPVTSILARLAGPAIGEYATAADERLQLTLHDGTSVILGEESMLRVAYEPSSDLRELYLEGFALLDVATDSTRPFIVHTGEALTRVLGTRFVIRAYAEEQSIAVAVAEGKVAVVPEPTEGSAGVLLTRGQVGNLSSNGMVEVRQDEREVNRLVRSVHGPLRFTDLPLAQVLVELERLYPVRFAVSDSALATQPLTIRLSGDHLESVLEAIEFAIQADYERRGDTITFTPHMGNQ